jgi:hypothetical protein
MLHLAAAVAAVAAVAALAISAPRSHDESRRANRAGSHASPDGAAVLAARA